MKARTAIATASLAALAGGGAVGLAAPAAASGHSAEQTLKYVSEQVSKVTFSKTTTATQDKDLSNRGKLIGFDTLSTTVSAKSGKGTALLALDVRGGILIGYLNVSSSKTNTGLITGGIGTVKGAFGKISAKKLNKGGTKTAVTVTYSIGS